MKLIYHFRPETHPELAYDKDITHMGSLLAKSWDWSIMGSHTEGSAWTEITEILPPSIHLGGKFLYRASGLAPIVTGEIKSQIPGLLPMAYWSYDTHDTEGELVKLKDPISVLTLPDYALRFNLVPKKGFDGIIFSYIIDLNVLLQATTPTDMDKLELLAKDGVPAEILSHFGL